MTGQFERFGGAFVGLALGALLGTFTDFDSSLLKGLIGAILGASLGHLLLTSATSARWNSECTKLLGAIHPGLDDIRSGLASFHVLLRANISSRRLPGTPFASLASRELEAIENRLKDIAESQVHLKREEVIACWEHLIRSSEKTVDATNIVSSADWNQFSTNGGIEVHGQALTKGVRIRRILLYEEMDKAHKTGVIDLEGKMSAIGIPLRKCSRSRIASDQVLLNLQGEIGTVDIVIFDQSTVLLTMVDDQKHVTGARVTTDERLVRFAIQFYENLWRKCTE